MITYTNQTLASLINNIQFDYPIRLIDINTTDESIHILNFEVNNQQVEVQYYTHNNCLWINRNNHYINFQCFTDYERFAFSDLKQFLTEALLSQTTTNFGIYVLGFKFEVQVNRQDKVLLWYCYNTNPEFTLNLKPVPRYIEVTNFYAINEILALRNLFKSTLNSSTTLNQDAQYSELPFYANNLEYRQIISTLNPGGIYNQDRIEFDNDTNPKLNPIADSQKITSIVLLDMMDKICKIIQRHHRQN